jgi:NAD(P)-dependent dehydrogenase (short-subunit alcohol dehydrogenase family)
MPSIVVFGAGPALGASVAARFAQEGYDVALVARDPAKLRALSASLGGEIATVTADVADRAQVRAAAEAVRRRVGVPDVVLYSPGDVSRLPVGALELTPEVMETWLPLHLLSPLTVIHTYLPAMLERDPERCSSPRARRGASRSQRWPAWRSRRPGSCTTCTRSTRRRARAACASAAC